MNKQQVVFHLSQLIHDDPAVMDWLTKWINRQFPDKFGSDRESWSEQLELEWYMAHAAGLNALLGEVISQTTTITD